jgi:hypothetical protein
MNLLHILFGVSFVSALPRLLNKPRAALDSTLPRMTNNDVFAIYHTCWDGKLIWPQNDMPQPVADQDSKQLNIYAIPATKPNTLTVHNYCNYDIYYQHLGVGSTLGEGILSAGTSYEHAVTGTVWKGSRTPSREKVVQVEYNVDQLGMLWYNISLIDCLGVTDKLKNKDTGACAGLEAGLQLGNKDHFSFQCKPGTWCDDQAYFYYVSLIQSGARVGWDANR